MSEQPKVKSTKHYKLLFDKIKTVDDLLYVLKIMFDGTTVGDCHPQIDELVEKGFIEIKE